MSDARAGASTAATDRRALALFDELLELDARQRAAALSRLAGEEPDLARAVEALLTADRTTAPLLAAASSPAPADGEGPPGQVDAALGSKIGPWRLVRRLGAGGMGEVFEVEREQDGLVQRAALKRLLAEHLAVTHRDRFRRERRILARLEHPAIARLIDGGVDDGGVPWLALELVDGEPITVAARRRGLDLAARIAAFLDVCGAVAYAHRALVVHRDIKPTNVFLDREARVRLLDFGIAKLLDESGSTGDERPPETPLTRHGELPFTPAYAAPEQIRGEAITTSTDVWALGVLLFELVAGRRPFDRPGASRPEIEHAVLEREPERLFAGAPAPGFDPPSGRLRRDLEAIVARALRKSAAERYATVDELAADLRSALAARPIVARRESALGRGLRFARRNAVASSLAALALAALVGGLVATRREASARAREARRAEEVKSFLTRLFEVASPEISGGAGISVADLLAEGAVRAEHDLAAAPDLRAELLGLLARLHREIGDRERAVALGETAVQAAIAAHGAGSSEAAVAAASLAETLLDDERVADAETLLAEAEQRQPPEASPGARALARARAALLAGQGKLAEAIAADRAILAATIARGGPLSEEALEDRAALADHLSESEALAESEAIQREIVAARVAAHGERHPSVARARHDLGISLERASKDAEAIAELERAVEIHRVAQGDAHWETVTSVRALASALVKAARYEEALARLADAEETLLAAGRGETFLYQNLLHDRGIALYQLGRFADAAALFQRVAAAWSAALGPNHRHTLNALSDAAGALAEQGRYADALPLLVDLLARQRAIAAPPATFTSTLNTLGIALLDLDRPGEALPYFREALAVNLATYGEDHFATLYTHQLVGVAQLERGDLAAAADELAAARRIATQVYAADDRRYGALDAATSALLLRTGKAAEALDLARSVLARRGAYLPPTSWKVGEAHLLVGEALAATGARAEARRSAALALEILAPARGESHRLTRRARALLAG